MLQKIGLGRDKIGNSAAFGELLPKEREKEERERKKRERERKKREIVVMQDLLKRKR